VTDIELDSFTQDDAYRLGRMLVDRAIEQGLMGMVDISTPNCRWFHVSFGGATADNDSWAERKAATAFRFETSSLEAARTLDGRDAFGSGWLDPARYVLGGGAVPIRVKGAGVVAVVSSSGLGTGEMEHDFAVAGIRELATSSEE
jgi:uncharacterized protein (UPF0303 family)